MPEYVLGQSDHENKRLISQAGFIQTITEQVFAGAGIGNGMRVLDLGCGVGDVAFVASKLVGPDGSVTAIDRDPGVLRLARQRAAESGLHNIAFVESTIDDFKSASLFDAVVGRFVLLYQADPAQTLMNAIQLIRSGGIVVSLETDMSVGLQASPPIPLWTQVGDWIVAAFRRAGIHDDMGAKLYPLFLQAGLPGPHMRYLRASGGGATMRPLYHQYAEMVRSVLPTIEKNGIASREMIDIDTLAARLETAIVSAKAQVYSMPMLAAWARKA